MSAPKHSSVTQSFSARADLPHTHPLASYLLQLITIKRSNLCVSADVTSTSALLKLAEEVGDSICVLKTHADIIDRFSERTITGLQEISRRKKFLIFEDRKFGDIGSTVQKQYTSGPLRIAHWAHLTNAHIFPGPAIITALSSAATQTLASFNQSVSTEISAGTPRSSIESGDSNNGGSDESRQIGDYISKGHERSGRKGSIVTATTTISQTYESSPAPAGLSRTLSVDYGEDDEERAAALQELGDPPLARGLLLLAQMSSAGNLMNPEYTAACVDEARSHNDFVLGFISQTSLNTKPVDAFLSFTPGVSLPPEGEVGGGWKGDGLGQQYRTPKTVVAEEGCDIVIVGRGILEARDRRREAERYRREAWKAYEGRVGKGRKK